MKIAIIVLLLIIAAFVAVMVVGSKRNEQKSDGSDSPLVNSLGSALGSFSPKLKVAQIQPPAARYNLQAQASYSLQIAADSKNKFRSAKFLVPVLGRQRCAHLEYKAAGEPPKDLDDLMDQDSEKKQGDADKKNPKTEVTFTILSAGGTIILERNSQAAQGCVVQLAK